MNSLVYDVLYNLALWMWGLLFAGCAYCSALLHIMTVGVMSILWGVACLFWLFMLGWYVIDCLLFSKRKTKKAAKRAGTR